MDNLFCHDALGGIQTPLSEVGEHHQPVCQRKDPDGEIASDLWDWGCSDVIEPDRQSHSYCLDGHFWEYYPFYLSFVVFLPIVTAGQVYGQQGAEGQNR